MPHVKDYDVYIFDCDGVILDSNNLKLDAMAMALASSNIEPCIVAACTEYFKNNFGRSRYHHVEHFFKNIIPLESEAETNKKIEHIIKIYAENCVRLYQTAKINSGFLEFIIPTAKVSSCYVASGSDQEELQQVFKDRDLDVFFDAIYGSPTSKYENVKKIVSRYPGKEIVMFGDALSDLLAATENNIDFVFVSSLSLAPLSVRGSQYFKGNEISDFIGINKVELV